MPDGAATEAPASDPAATPRRVALPPDESPMPAEARRCIAVTACTSFAVAGRIAAGGRWPVLPFAGPGLARFAVALATSRERRRHVQTVEVGATQVRITSRAAAG